VSKKVIHYLCGLPRAGNTLLSTLFNQNPNIASTANSIVTEIFKNLDDLKRSDTFLNYPDHGSFDNVIKAVVPAYYKNWSKPIIIDRGPWGAPNNLAFLKHYINSKPKIIVLVREVLEVLGSFIEWSNKNQTAFLNRIGCINVEQKCEALMNTDNLIIKELIAIKHLTLPKNEGIALFIDYNDLVNEPEKTLKKIYKFLDIPYYSKHNYTKLNQFKVNEMSYDDKIIGDNLHTIKTKGISKTKRNLKKLLPKTIIDKYKNLNELWK
jgi:sulfotransferase